MADVRSVDQRATVIGFSNLYGVSTQLLCDEHCASVHDRLLTISTVLHQQAFVRGHLQPKPAHRYIR